MPTEPTPTTQKFRFSISPTSLSVYFLLDCERYLRWISPRKGGEAELRMAESDFKIPKVPFRKSPLFEALTQGGVRWEEEIVNVHLKDHIYRVPGREADIKARLSYAETLEALRQIQPGQWIYQATLIATESYYQRFELDASEIQFSDCFPDFIFCTPAGKLRIVDAKASEHLKVTHKIQTGLYVGLLQEVLKTEVIDREVDTESGAIWLGQQARPSLFDMASILPHVEHLLKVEVPRILATDPQQSPWHVHFKCEWCQWFHHCRQEAEQTQDLSLLPYISPENKRFLNEQVLADSRLQSLYQALQDPDTADRHMAGSISLRAKGGELYRQSQALVEQKIVPQLSRSLALPRNEDITVLLAVEREPSTKEVYAISVLVSLASWCKEIAEELDLPAYKAQLFVAQTPADCNQIQQDAIRYLHDLYSRVDQWNRPREWAQKVSLQSYSFDAYEKVNLTDMLIKALGSDVGRQALELLFFFRHLDNLYEDEHPDPSASNPNQIVAFPMVSVLAAMRELVALPIPLAWQLGTVLPMLIPPVADDPYAKKFEDFAHYPVTNYLDSDLIHRAWDGNQGAAYRVQSALKTRTYALHQVLQALRQHPAIKPMLFAYASKFKLPDVADYQNPILSRLAFITMNESIVRALQARQARTQDERQRGINQIAFRIKALGENRFQVLTPTNQIKEDTFANLIIWPPTPEGEMAQALYDDLGWYNRNSFKIPPHLHRSLINITDVESDPVSGQNQIISLDILDKKVFCDGIEPEVGSEWYIAGVYNNTLTKRIFNALDSLDAADPGGFSDLLQRASSASHALPLPESIQQALLDDYPNWKLTASQEQALLAVLRQSLTLVWGPPGTGKTHFIASTLAGLLQAHQHKGQEYRIMVTAFTKAALINVMQKLAKRLQELQLEIPLLIVGDHAEVLLTIKKEEIFRNFNKSSLVVIGSTSWNFRELQKKTRKSIDLLVIDEASQMTVSESAQLWQVLDANSRVMVVGDHYQLPPIIADEYPEPEGQEPLLTRSIFEAFQHAEKLERDQNPLARQIVYPLLECWRMNQTLNQFSAQELYTMQLEIPDRQGQQRHLRYACASKAVAAQRMTWQESPLQDVYQTLLDPDYPLTLCVLENVKALQENQIEAELVAQTTLILRQNLLHQGQVLETGSREDLVFWNKELFIVSPHHVQIMAIKRALAQVYDWQSPPFVGTVDKMQGQEANVVLVSYGVSDVEAAIQEKDFIYDLNRLNVAITRAKQKCIVFLPRPLLEGSPAVLESERASRGLAYMQKLEQWLKQSPEATRQFLIDEDIQLSVYRRNTGWGES